MRDFDSHFDEVGESINKSHKRIQFLAPIVVLVNLAIVWVILGFVGWVIIKVMSHFGVL